MQQAPARTAATPQLQSSLRLSPSVDELRQDVPVSDMGGRPGAAPARYRMADGYWLTCEAAEQLGVSVRTVEGLVAASRHTYTPVVGVGCGTAQRLKTKESSYGTFGEHR